MKKDELIEFLQRQVEYLQGKLDEALKAVNSLTLSNKRLQATIEELRNQIASLEEALKGKGAGLNKEKAARQAVQRLQGSPSERQSKETPQTLVHVPDEPKPEKKRGNNGAKRKTYPECEVETVIVEPDSPRLKPPRSITPWL